MFQDLVLFLGLLGFVCSIGMRVMMRGKSGNSAGDDIGHPALHHDPAPPTCLNVRARDASAPARSARRRQ